jgi:glycine cleavage system aminomethyltransferase T/glycine/D-amino acid oxidase-like deaminating enzyme
MAELPRRARVVVIGAGIVGNALVHHLAELGWGDIVQVDQGPFPNPGGSTGHASSMIRWLEPHPRMAAVTAESAMLYDELGALQRSGGLEVARTPELFAEFRRRDALARVRGVRAELLTSAQVGELAPFVDTSIVLGGFYLPDTGVLDAVGAGAQLRSRATSTGALVTFPNTEVTGIDAADGHVTAVRTTRGDVATDCIALCCGVWSPRLARMAGTSIPMVPGVLQQVSIGPIAAFAELEGEIRFPIVRDQDSKLFFRQHGADMEVGSYDHPAMLVEPDDIPSIEEAVLSPTELPFTQEHFDRALERAYELMPDIFGDERAGIRYAINGLISLDADNLPIIGELPGVRGLWSANRVDVKVAPAIARITAEWMTHGRRDVYGHPFDIERFAGHERTARHVRARSIEKFERQYEIVHPAEEWLSDRPVRVSPIHARLVELGAELRDVGGWEVPYWFRANETLVGEYGERVMPRPSEWDARWWSPIVNAEHLAMRERVGLADVSAHAAWEIAGSGACAALQGLVVEDADLPTGSAIDAWLLDPTGAVVTGLTVLRLAPDRYRLFGLPDREARDRTWLHEHLPADGSVALVDVSTGWAAFRVLGGRAAELVEGALGASAAVSTRVVATSLGAAPALAFARGRREDGDRSWEVHVPADHALHAWDALWEAAREIGAVAVGSGVVRGSVRLEAGRPALGTELGSGATLVEAGLAGQYVKDADFIGRSAYLGQRETAPARVLAALAVDGPADPPSEARFMLGGEPILGPDGAIVRDGTGRACQVSSAGSSPSVGRHVLMAYLPPDKAVAGTRLAVEYFGERYPLTVTHAAAWLLPTSL